MTREDSAKNPGEGVTEDELGLRSLIDSAPDGFLVVDRHGRIVLVNASMERLFGYTKQEMVGAPVEKLIPERFLSRHVVHRSEYYANPRLRPMGLGLQLVGRRKDASEFPVEISLSPLPSQKGELVTAVVRDVSERRGLEAERNLLAVELETEHERDRIAMDLHDGIMQDIYAAALTLELAVGDIGSDAVGAEKGVERAIDQLHEVVRNIRSYIFDLRPRQFSGDLPGALRDIGNEFGQNSHISIEVLVTDALDVEETAAVALYQIAHEGLSNIQKHAHADRVRLILDRVEGRGRLRVEDNGRGFDTSIEVTQAHRGLRNMAARAKSIDAELSVESSPAGGTVLTVEFALRDESV